MVPIIIPPPRVVGDIFSHRQQFPFVPDDAVKEALLPYDEVRLGLTRPDRYRCLEVPDDNGQRPLSRFESHIGNLPRLIRIVDEDDPMHMIRHDNEGVDGGIRRGCRYVFPAANDDVTKRRQPHSLFGDITEETCTPVRTDRDEIESRTGVIIVR